MTQVPASERTEQATRVAPRPLCASWFGVVDYAEAWSLQRALFEARASGGDRDVVLLLEHPPTYTLGRRARPEDVLADERQRAARGIALYSVDRGGRATYHGPGQLVGYPIMALGERYDVLGYLRALEEALIHTARDLGVAAHRDPEHTGVWVGPNKIGAIGVKITRGVTMHGFAFNVATDLTMFEGIVPCGIQERGVTSVATETGVVRDASEVARIASAHLGTVLGRPLTWLEPASLRALAATPFAPNEPSIDEREAPAALAT